MISVSICIGNYQSHTFVLVRRNRKVSLKEHYEIFNKARPQSERVVVNQALGCMILVLTAVALI